MYACLCCQSKHRYIQLAAAKLNDEECLQFYHELREYLNDDLPGTLEQEFRERLKIQ
jgi:hypothetical protein